MEFTVFCSILFFYIDAIHLYQVLRLLSAVSGIVPGYAALSLSMKLLTSPSPNIIVKAPAVSLLFQGTANASKKYRIL